MGWPLTEDEFKKQVKNYKRDEMKAVVHFTQTLRFPEPDVIWIAQPGHDCRVTIMADGDRVRFFRAIYFDRQWIDNEVLTKIHRDYKVFEPEVWSLSTKTFGNLMMQAARATTLCWPKALLDPSTKKGYADTMVSMVLRFKYQPKDWTRNLVVLASYGAWVLLAFGLINIEHWIGLKLGTLNFSHLCLHGSCIAPFHFDLEDQTDKNGRKKCQLPMDATDRDICRRYKLSRMPQWLQHTFIFTQREILGMLPTLPV